VAIPSRGDVLVSNSKNAREQNYYFSYFNIKVKFTKKSNIIGFTEMFDLLELSGRTLGMPPHCMHSKPSLNLVFPFPIFRPPSYKSNPIAY